MGTQNMEEEKRPWREEKRSWILYKDKMQEIEDIILDEVDGNTYIFDCSSVRLSIWSEKWQAFADVGVSRFLKQEEERKAGGETEVYRGTKIFYKGIEIQKKYREIDAELIEFIDIKGELSRNLINLSRGGFTREGENYLEKQLYPGLLAGVHRVLRHLEETDGFALKVKQNMKKKCENLQLAYEKKGRLEQKTDSYYQEQRKFIAFVVSVSVLSYYAGRTEWRLEELLDQSSVTETNSWEELIQYINKELLEPGMEKILEELSCMTNFFALTVFAEKNEKIIYRKIGESGKNHFFSEIFDSSKRWAIRQMRMDEYSGWKLQLIQLSGEGQELYNKLISRTRTSEEEEELEKWAEEVCSKGHLGTMYVESASQFIMNWLLKNIPTIAMFCSFDGNVRVNILSPRIYPSIYMNKSFQYLILERIFQYAEEGKQRFSTIVWQGRDFFGCRDLPFSIYFVKRGYLAQYSYRKCIVPIEGAKFVKWKNSQKRKEIPDVCRKLEMFFEAIDIKKYLYKIQKQEMSDNDRVRKVQEYLNNSETDVAMEIANVLWEIILHEIEETRYNNEASMVKILEAVSEKKKEWENIFLSVSELYITEMSEEERHIFLQERILKNSELSSLCIAWYHVFIDGESEIEDSFRQEIAGIFNEISEDSTNKEKRIVSYIKEYGIYAGEESEIKKNLKKYQEEISNLIFEMEMRPIHQVFKEFHSISGTYKKHVEKIYNMRKKDTQNE